MPMEKYLDKYPPVLSTDEVAEVLGVTSKTVRVLINSGELKGIRVGKLYKVTKDVLLEYLDCQT